MSSPAAFGTSARRRFDISRITRLGINPENGPKLLASALLSIWLLANWLGLLRAIIRDYTALPVWDYWRTAELYSRYRAFDISVLWIQHNEHRIVFPEIVYIADALLFKAHQILPLVVSLTCYFFVWITLAFVLLSEKAISPLARNIAILISGVIIGWPGAWVAVGDAFLLQWTMAQVAVVVGLLLLANVHIYGRSAYLAGTIACGVVATYSSGNGMLLWPIYILFSFILHLRKSHNFAIALAAVVSMGCYFIGYHSSRELNLIAIISHPVYFADFVASYLSMPFGVLNPPWVGIAIGYGNLALFLFLLFTAARRQLLTSKPAILFIGSYLFTLATAALTSTGRMDPADTAFAAAKAARYVSLPLANWGMLASATVWLAAKEKWSIASPARLGLVMSVALLGIFPKLMPWLEGMGTFFADKQLAILSVESGLMDSTLLAELFPDPNWVIPRIGVLRRNHLAIYSDHGPATWVGKAARKEFPRPWKDYGQDELTWVSPVTGGLEIAGSEPTVRNGAQIVFIDGKGEIVGLGEKLPAGVPTVLGSKNGSHNHWIGFVNNAYHGSVFSAYLVQDGTLVRLTRTVPDTNIREAGHEEMGSPIPNLFWRGSNWTQNLAPSADIGKSFGKDYWSSWNGSDASSGQISSSAFPLPSTHCLIVPVVHGPSTDGLSAEIINAETGKKLADIPTHYEDTHWKFWRVPIEQQVQSVKIFGRDDGTGWGQWLALGSPFSCR